MTRFRRNKDELARGLTPEQAHAERATAETVVKKPVARKGNGEIVLRIRPRKDVDADYFEHLDGKEIVLEEDVHFYKWLDHYLGTRYPLASELFLDILDQGIGILPEKLR